MEYGWPGNIRELQNVIERAVILASGEIDVSHLNIEVSPEPSPEVDGLLQKTEREAIQKVLAEVGGNRKKAAQILGIEDLLICRLQLLAQFGQLLLVAGAAGRAVHCRAMMRERA